MSVQLVDDEHIRVLVWAGLQPHPDGPLTWSVDQAGSGSVDQAGSPHVHQLVGESAGRVGAMLHNQNIAAYRERYGDDDDFDPDDEDAGFEGVGRYLHAAPRQTGWTPLDLFKAVQFYVYQSFHDEDHDEAAAVEALQFCGALVRRLGPELPGWGDPSFPAALMATADWDASPWGITTETRPIS